MGKKRSNLKKAALGALAGAATLGSAALAKKYYDVHHGPFADEYAGGTWPFNKAPHHTKQAMEVRELTRELTRLPDWLDTATEWGPFQSNVQGGEGAGRKKKKKEEEALVFEEPVQILEQSAKASPPRRSSHTALKLAVGAGGMLALGALLQKHGVLADISQQMTVAFRNPYQKSQGFAVELLSHLDDLRGRAAQVVANLRQRGGFGAASVLQRAIDSNDVDMMQAVIPGAFTAAQVQQNMRYLQTNPTRSVGRAEGKWPH